MVKSSPMLMSSPMVKAYLAGLKTQTRRTRGLNSINKNPDEWQYRGIQKFTDGLAAIFGHPGAPGGLAVKLPYGGEGDTLWFKETYALICEQADPFCLCGTDEERKANHHVEYRADTGNKYPGDWPEEEARGNDEAPKWKPSIFMNKIYSRFLDISILSVHVQRLHDITEADAYSEGVEKLHIVYGHGPSYRDTYFELWKHLNGKKMPVENNPWVWVYEFPRYEREEVKA